VPNLGKKPLAALGLQKLREVHAWSQARLPERLDNGEIDFGSIIKGVKRESTVLETVRGEADSGQMAKIWQIEPGEGED
jgi:hypothetical protein